VTLPVTSPTLASPDQRTPSVLTLTITSRYSTICNLAARAAERLHQHLLPQLHLLRPVHLLQQQQGRHGLLQHLDLVQRRVRDRSSPASQRSGKREHPARVSSLLLDAFCRLRRLPWCLAKTSNGNYEVL